MHVEIIENNIENLKAKAINDLVVDLSFSEFDIDSFVDKTTGTGYGAIIFRIIDENNIMMGDTIVDNMLVLIKF